MILNEEQFQSEVDYSTVMLFIKEWLASGIINKTEFSKIERLYAEKYKPVWGWESRQN